VVLDSSKKNIETDCTSVECRLLRYKSKMLPIFLNVELCNIFSIKLNERKKCLRSALSRSERIGVAHEYGTHDRVIKSFN